MAESGIWTQSMFSGDAGYQAGAPLACSLMPATDGALARLQAFCGRQGVSYQDFTPAESRCISDKISTLVGEGKEQDQAIAIAISECAPEKARAFAEAAAVEAPNVEGFRAEQTGDGTWTVFDVPVFSVHTDDRLEEMGEEPEHYGAEWLQRADEVAKAREAEGYLGPLHVRHHGGPTEVEEAGKFRLRGVRDFVYEGEPIPTNFVDFVAVPDAVYQDLKAGKLPFRSVEIKGPAHAEILSIALLQTEVPFFRYGNFRIASEERFAAHKDKKKKRKRSLLAARCYQLDGDRRRFLTFDFAQGAPVTTAANTFPNPVIPAAAAPVAATSTRREDVAAAVEQMLPLLQQLMEMMQALAAREDGGAAAADGEAPPVQASNQPAEQRAAVPPAPTFQATVNGHQITTTTAGAGAVVHNSEVSEMRGKLAAMEGQLRKFTAARTVESQSAGDLKALETAGADADDIKTYTAMAAKDPAAAKAYAASVVTFLAAQPAAPPSHGTEIPAAEPERPEVAAYIVMGPDRHSLARRKYQAWLKTSRQNSLEDYLRANVNPDSYLNPQPTTHS